MKNIIYTCQVIYVEKDDFVEEDAQSLFLGRLGEMSKFPQTFHESSQNYLKGSLTQLQKTFADV